jgi:hypothetical protein
MKPFYEQSGITIYHGDARDVLPGLRGDVVITDPVWPGASVALAGAERPYELFAEVAALVPAVAGRLVVQLGCDSDPRFLLGVPVELPFFRVCSLEYLVPSYKGRLLMTGDYAYVFGSAPAWRRDRVVIPGRCVAGRDVGPARVGRLPGKKSGGVPGSGHLCPRRLGHLKWLVKWFADGVVIDPFMGGGTTLVAAKYYGLLAIGVEVEEKSCELAAVALQQEVMCLEGLGVVG